jgi:putative peptidoglycan lipid II flippase
MKSPDKNTSDESVLNEKPGIVDSSKHTTSIGRSLSIATAIMMGSVLLSRVAGLLRDVVMAHFGGTSVQMDAYVTSFMIPELLNHFLAGGFLSVTFIPIFQGRLLKGDLKGAWSSFSNLLTIGTFMFLIFIPLGIIFTPQIIGLMVSPDKDPEFVRLTIHLTRIILPAQLFFYWGAFFSAVQMSKQRFFLPAMSPLFYNIGIIIGGILLAPRFGIEGFSWGVLIGAFLGNVLIQVPGLIKVGLQFKPRFNLFDSDLLLYIRKTVPLIMGLGMTFSNEIFFRFFSAILPEGTTSSVNFALKTMMIMVALFGQASGAAFYPYLSKLAALKEYSKMTEVLNSVVTRMALYLIPLSGIMMVLSEQIISILFERGSFTHQSTVQTASIFTIYLIGAFGFSATMIVNRSFYAKQNTVLPMIISTCAALVSIPLYIVLSKILGGQGIAWAATLSMTMQLIVTYLLWCKINDGWKPAMHMGITLIKVFLICIVGCFAGYLLKSFSLNLLGGKSWSSNVLVCVISAVPALLIISLLYEITGIQRFREFILGLLKKKMPLEKKEHLEK